MTTETTAGTTATETAPKESVSAAIRRIHKEQPDLPLTELAKQVNKAPRYVYTVLYAERKKQAEIKAAKKAAREAKKAGLQPADTVASASEKRKPGRPKKNAATPAQAAPQGQWGNVTVAVSHDPVNHPAHYTDGGMEVIDILKAKLSPEEYKGYLRGNVIKYAARMGKKAGAQATIDAGKMAWYAKRLADETGVGA